jgi:hypothetical protein
MGNDQMLSLLVATTTFVVLILLLIAPVVTYWIWGYRRRKKNILGSLDGHASKVYLETFHPNDYAPLRGKARELKAAKLEVTKFEAAKLAAEKLETAKRKVAQLDEATPDADAAKREVATLEAEKREVEELKAPNLEAAKQNLAELDKFFKDKLASFYNKRFGLWRFICPFILMICVAALLLGSATLPILNWINLQRIDAGPLPPEVVLAIFGGYVWVLYDIVLKSTNEFLLPRDLYWAAFRMLASVPAGCAFAPFDTHLKYPLAFSVAALPAWSLQSIARRITYRIVGADQSAADTVNELVSLPCIDFSTAQNLSDEGITSISQLANWDPVELTIRLGLPFSYVVGIIGDALLWNYLNSKDRMEAFRLRGISGAFDCNLFWYDLTETGDPGDKADAEQTLQDLSDALKISPGGLKILIWNVAYDPNSRFIYAVWGDIVN